MNNIKKINSCPISKCEGETYFDLGYIPLVNNLNNSRDESLNCPKYPLAIQYFPNSGLSSLTHIVDPSVLYKNYLYKTGVSLPYIKHCEEMFNYLEPYLNLNENHKILDIGGNDGTLLKTFLNINPSLNVLNIDASENLTDEAEKNGIPSINEFWGVNLAKNLNSKFKLITTTNCFQHTEPISSFVEGVSISLEDTGIWCLEFPYWQTDIETHQFDQIYHEHVYYYSIRPLIKLFDKYNLKIIRAVNYPIHGGTMRLLITRKDNPNINYIQDEKSIQLIIENEKYVLDDYIKWGEEVQNHISKSRELILNLKQQGYTIAGFGAAAKGCTFLNSAKINYEQIEYVIDDTDLKQDKYIPGTGIQIVPRDILKKNSIDYIIILAHNFKDYIIESLRKDDYEGKFILFLPNIEII